MKKCPSFPGYSVNEKGEVFSHRIRKRIPNMHCGSYAVICDSACKKLSPALKGKGYLQVSIKTATTIRPIGVHVLVADAYIGPRPKGMLVRHLDDNPKNNHPSNLRYGTYLDNAHDRLINGGYKRGGEHVNAKLTNQQSEEIRDLRRKGVKVKELAEKFDISIATIECVIYNKHYLNKPIDKPENWMV